jgi:nitrite reductase/ring-hydroxylating ferredoxin subunit
MKLFELADLQPGRSVRFPLNAAVEGFAVRDASGAVRAYVNICPHRFQPVDVGDGRLWQASGEIECQAHGARFDPSTGACTGGPCNGQPLSRLEIEERDGAAWLLQALDHR